MTETNGRTGRIYFMDEVRGFDLLLMVAFHGFYTAGYLFGFRPAAWLFNFFNPVEPFFAGLFILICGISCRLSHSNWKRGGLLLAVAAVMSAFLFVFMREEMIWFGILHFLAVSILLFALCRPLLDKIPPAWGVAACAVLTLITWWVPGYRGSRSAFRGCFPSTYRRACRPAGGCTPGAGPGRGGRLFPTAALAVCVPGGQLPGAVGQGGTVPPVHVCQPGAVAGLAGAAHADYLRCAPAGAVWPVLADSGDGVK